MRRPLLLLSVLTPLLCSAGIVAEHQVEPAVFVEQMPSAAPAAAPSSFIEQVESYATAPNVAWALGTLLSMGAVAKFLTERRKRIVALVVKNAFYATEDAANETSDPRFDKLANALKTADAWCVAHSWRPLTPGEQAIATLQLQSQHGEEIAKAKVAAAAPPAVVVPS